MIAGLTQRNKDGGTAAPDAPAQILYQPNIKTADLRRGRLDGRRRTPSYTQVSDRITTDGWFTTAYSEELQELGQTRMQDELHASKRLVAPKRRRVAGLRERLVTTAEEIGRTEETLRQTATDISPEELIPRNPLEAQRGTNFVRSRRRSMRDREAQLTRDRLAALTREADDIRRQIAETCEEMVQDLEWAQVRVRLQATHTELRVATYWRALTETHPEGRQLTVVLPRVELRFPDWHPERPEDPAAEAIDDEAPTPDPTEG